MSLTQDQLDTVKETYTAWLLLVNRPSLPENPIAVAGQNIGIGIAIAGALIAEAIKGLNVERIRS